MAANTSPLDVTVDSSFANVLAEARPGMMKEVRPLRPSGVGQPREHISYVAVLVAAMIFIIVIAWFETIRLWIFFFFIKDDAIYYNALSYFIYSIVATIIAVILLWVLYKVAKTEE